MINYVAYFLQKPGGIIALLDEAWYAALVIFLLFVFSYGGYSFLKLVKLFSWLFNAACFQSLHMKHFHRSCARHLQKIIVFQNQSSPVLILLYYTMQGR